MRIAFDYQTFVMQPHGGISRYIVRLVENLAILGQDARIFAPLHRNEYAQYLPPEIVYGNYIKDYPRKTWPLFMLLNRMMSKKKIEQWSPSLVHETYYSSRGSIRGACPVVVTVHDMIHELFPSYFKKTDGTAARKKLAIQRADHIICVSNNTKNDLLNIFNVSKEKVSVVHHGFDSLPIEETIEPLVAQLILRPFLLYVGNRVGYKNFNTLLVAIASSQKLKTDFDIIAFGGGLFNSDERQKISELGFSPGQVQQLSGNDSLLGQLYKQAVALVYPSLYEGFGLPPLEAMSNKCPVICSNTSSLPEVVGNAGKYFDPTSFEDMARAIELVVYSASTTEKLIEQGVKNSSLFNWNKCANETIQVYKKMATK